MITVAMAMHNSSHYLRECIDSILAQSYGDFELLIADDGSDDNSMEIAAGYDDSRIRIIKRGHDFTATLNSLLDEARGRYIARMDSDDVMMADRLKRELEYLEAHPETDAVCSGAIRIYADGETIGRIGEKEGHEITLRKMAEANMVCNPTSMMRRSVIERGNLRYRKEFEYAEDYRFWTEFLESGSRIYYLPETLIKYRTSVGQVTSRHRNEMMAASDRIRAELTAHLIEAANHGYQEPEIRETGNELTLIIPFLNEGEEVENTVRSFIEFAGGRVDVVVINDASYDSYPYMERLRGIEGVMYVLNRKRLGVAGSRDKGVELCRTPYFLLLDAHMRAYDDRWVTEIPRLLRDNDRRILCCQTRVLKKDKDGRVVADERAEAAYGARMTFRKDQLMPGIEWIKEEREPGKEYEVIPCILGAGYGASKRYWKYIGGLKGLKEYGCDEQFLSLKTWLEGGTCTLLKEIVLGHIYRDGLPYGLADNSMVHNHLVISERLFPSRERIIARAATFVKAGEEAESIVREVREETLDRIINVTEEKFEMVKNLNLCLTETEIQLRNRINDRLGEIYRQIIKAERSGPGIFEGSAGFSIWLYHYGQFRKNTEATACATSFINDAIKQLPENDISFSSGLSGIGWAIVYLEQQGLISSFPNILSQIDERVAAIDPEGFDSTFEHGKAGILAYMCARAMKDDARKKLGRLADLANEVLKESKDPTAIFYALLWQEIAREHEGRVPKPNLKDWIKPSNYISKNSNFWRVSLRDGVLATSIVNLL